MTGNFDQLGRLSLAILEKYVETILGEKFVNTLREPTDRDIAIASALKNTEDRFTKQFEDHTFAEHIFQQQISAPNTDLLADAISKYYARPTNPDFPAALRRIFTDSLPHLPAERIDSAIPCYMLILTEELALVDEKFRENVRALADLRGELSHQNMVNVLSRIENLLKANQISPTSKQNDLDQSDMLKNVSNIISRAEALAISQKYDRVERTHLFLAILTSSKATSRMIFEEAVQKLEQEISMRLINKSPLIKNQKSIKHTNSFEKILTNAKRIAENLKMDSVSPTHLFHAILDDPGDTTDIVLINLQIDQAAAIRKIIELEKNESSTLPDSY
jgi:hypothetical protein